MVVPWEVCGVGLSVQVLVWIVCFCGWSRLLLDMEAELRCRCSVYCESIVSVEMGLSTMAYRT